MEAYAISSANLDVIENNLGAVANELSGVVKNVSNVNTQVNVVEEKVTSLDSEIKNLVKEIRETTIITNARQNIMYNNDQIERKYGYFNDVRRTTLSVIDSVNNSKVSKDYLINLRQKILLNNPNYWLTNALASLISWFVDDKDMCDKELLNALKKNSLKTKLFFLFINLKFNRISTAINWLDSYLYDLNPLELDSSFIEILELCMNESFGLEGKTIIVKKISDWLNILYSNKKIDNEELNKWIDFIDEYETKDIDTPYLDHYSNDNTIINDNIFLTSTYSNVLEAISDIVSKENFKVDIDKLIKRTIEDYEDDEKEFQNDNFKNKLIIECNGDREKAQALFEKQQNIYSNRSNLISIFDNIVMYPERYDVCENTRKIALVFVKNYIKRAYKKINESIIEKDISITFDDYNLYLNDNSNMNSVNSEIESYVNLKYNKSEKTLWAFLIIIDLIGVIGMFFTISKMWLFILIIIFLVIGNAMLLYKIFSDMNAVNLVKNNKKKELLSMSEKLLAEYKDYCDTFKSNKQNFERLNNFLDGLDIKNYINSTNERNIDIG